MVFSMVPRGGVYSLGLKELGVGAARVEGFGVQGCVLRHRFVRCKAMWGLCGFVEFCGNKNPKP